MNFLRNMSNQGGIRSAEAEASAGPAAPIIKQGLMRKQGGSVKSWKERWFTLTKDHLSYYKSRDDKEPIDAIPVNKIRVCQREETDTRNPSQFPHYFSVDVGHRVYVIGARSEADRDEWVEEISKLVRELTKELPTLPSDLRTSNDNIAAASDAGSIRSAHSNSALNSLGAALTVTPTATAAAPGASAPAPAAAAAPAVAKPRVLLTGTVHKKDFDAKEYVASLRALVRLENYSDVVLAPATGNERYPAHRPVLAARAPALAQQIDVKQPRPQITVPHTTGESLARVIDYLYTDEVAFTPDNVVEVYAAAGALNLTRLQQLATVYIRDNVTVDNVLPMLQAANRLKAADVEKFLFKFFQNKERYNDVIRQPEISEIAMDNKPLYVAISQVLAQPADKYNVDFAGVTVGESTLAIDFTALYISGSHADIRVVAKDGELPAHRAILAARSPRLIEEGLLVADEEGRQGRVLKFPTLPLSVMEAFVQALYTNTLAIDDVDTVYGLMELAHRVEQEAIISVCEGLFSQNLNKDTAIKSLLVASQYNLVVLKKQALTIIVKEAPTVLTRKNLRTIGDKWSWCMVDIIRALVRGDSNELTEDEADYDKDDSDDD